MGTITSGCLPGTEAALVTFSSSSCPCFSVCLVVPPLSHVFECDLFVASWQPILRERILHGAFSEAEAPQATLIMEVLQQLAG